MLTNLGGAIKRIAFLMAAIATVTGVVAFMAPASGQTDGEAAPIYGIKIPPLPALLVH